MDRCFHSNNMSNWCERKVNKMNLKSIFLKFFIPVTLMLLFIFSSCTGSSTQQIAASGSIDTEAQAIQVASQFVPAEIVAKASISTSSGMFSNRTSAFKEWTVYFSDFSVNKSDLGWKADDKTVLGDEEPYTNIDVNLNGVTGDLVSREAFIPVNWEKQTTIPEPTDVSPKKQIEVNINGLADEEQGTLRLGTEAGLDIEDTLATYPLNGTGNTISIELSPSLADGYYMLLLEAPTYYFRDPRGYSFMVSGGLIVDPTGSAATFTLKPWPTFPILEPVYGLSAPPKQGMPVVPN